jgi:D-alanyl-D-alanine dipeptidase
MLESTEFGAEDLVQVFGIQSSLQYFQLGLAGAMAQPFLAAPASLRLQNAAEILQNESTTTRDLALLIWDAYRTRETQQSLFMGYVQQLQAFHNLSPEEAQAHARHFVASPDGVFPHGTGGAVDVTLLLNKEPAFMGTEFDAFVPKDAADWYRDHPPQTHAETIAAQNREILRSAMEGAGFVGIASEWWHFEWGTGHWARETGQTPVLTRILHR